MGRTLAFDTFLVDLSVSVSQPWINQAFVVRISQYETLSTALVASSPIFSNLNELDALRLLIERKFLSFLPQKTK